jgi:hypothetical protein
MPAKGQGRPSFSFTGHDSGHVAIGDGCVSKGARMPDNSIFLARLLGPSMLVVGAGLLVNRATYRALSRGFLDSPALIFLIGLIAFVAGLAIVLTHNVWEFGWPVIITIFGWASLFAGIFRIVFPAAVTRLGTRLTQSDGPLVGGIVLYLGLGAWLSYAGYFV